MTKKHLILLAAIVFLFSLCKILDIQFNKMDNLNNYAKEIESKLHQKEKEIEDLYQDSLFWKKTEEFINKKYEKDKKGSNKYLKILSSFGTKSYNITLYKKDSLVFWTNDRIFLDAKTLDQLIISADTTYMAHLANGYFEVSKKTFDDIIAISLIPIKNDYTLKSEYLVNKFVDNYHIPQTVDLITAPTDYPVHARHGNILGYLGAKGKIIDTSHLTIILWIGILGLLLLGILITQFALFLKKKSSWGGPLFFITTILILRFISYHYEFSAYFEELRLFKKVFSEMAYNYSIGDILFNTLLLLWLIVFFHKGFKIKEFKHNSKPLRFLLTFVFYFATLAGVLMIIFFLQNIILHSDIIINFDNVINFDFYSIITIVSIVFLFFTLFFYSHRMILSLLKIGLSLNERIVVFVIALLFSTPLIIYGGFQIDPFSILIPAAIYVMSFDYFVEELKNPSLIMVTIWLFAFTFFTTLLLYQFNQKKEENTLKTYAKALSSFRDTLAEKELANIHKKLDADIQRITKSENYDPKIADRKIARLFKKHYSESPYLSNNYENRLLLPHLRGYEGAHIESTKKYKKFRRAYLKSSTTDYANIRFYTPIHEQPSYMSKSSFPGDEEEIVTMYLKTRKKRIELSKVYSELLEAQPYKHLKRLDEYHYAIYDDKKRIDSNSGMEYPIFPDFNKIPKRLKYIVAMSSGKSEVIYRGKNGLIVVISKNLGGFFKLISLFSYIFSILLAAILLILGLTLLFQTIFKPKKKLIKASFTLKNKIQFSFLGLIFASLIGVAFVALIFFKSSSEKYHKNRLFRKVNSVLTDAHIRIDEKWHEKKKLDFQEIAENLSDIHKMDVNIYDSKGDLICSSENDIFDKNIIYKKMEIAGYHELADIKQEISVKHNRVGDLKYKSAFVPLEYRTKKDKNLKTIYIEVPYYSKLRKLKSDVYDFIGNLLNAFIILLILAIVISIIASKELVRPLTVIREKMKKVKLGSNEPIEWKINDEIGNLVDAYNDMIAKVEESTQTIVQSERESTWREMAQMVAHEIKTPLTPMKLGVQRYFHAKTSDRELPADFVDKTFEALGKQIDAISNIVTEFSSLAKMPTTNNHPFDINDIVKSVHELYRQNELTAKFDDISGGNKPNIVNADDGHIRRVIVNLYQNAMQAIPDNKKGRIKTFIYRKNNNVIIKITDNGTGIPEDMQDKVFQPKFTTKRTGSGLGLAMSKNIIDIAGGKIYFETEVDKGTSFFIELPLSEEK